MEECSPLLKKGDTRLRVERYISRDKAREIILLFNTFRRDKTSIAFEYLFWYFIWNPNGMEPPSEHPLRFVEIVPDTPPTEVTMAAYRVMNFGGESEKEHDKYIDGIQTAATDGFTLWINRTKIMNKGFDQKDTHFGALPKEVSHFAAVMLHEFGHMLRQRADRTTVNTLLRESPGLRKCYDEFQRKISKARESYRKGEGESPNHLSDEREEWFADIIAKSFILYAYGDS